MAVYTKEKIAKSKSAALELLVKVGSRRYLLQFILFIFFIIASKLQGNWMWRPLQVLQITRASSVASELRISDVFNKFYGELGQKSKLPDSGESTLKQKNKRKHSCAVLPFCKWYFLFFFTITDTHVACFCYSAWQNLRAARGPCRGSPQRHGQQLGQTVQSLPGRVKRTGGLTWRRRHKRKSWFSRVLTLIENEPCVQMTSSTKEPKLLVVAGCLRGTTALMVNFTKTTEEGWTFCGIHFIPHVYLCSLPSSQWSWCFFVSDPQMSKDIFQYALKAITPKVNISAHTSFLFC